MPRPKVYRRVTKHPEIKGFRPFGAKTQGGDPVVIFIEEYEAIRLCDYEMLNHENAAARMYVSRPTFTRVYENARRKIAQAFSECRAIVFEGGKVVIDSEWFRCMACDSLFTLVAEENRAKSCPLCGNTSVKVAAEDAPGQA